MKKKLITDGVVKLLAEHRGCDKTDIMPYLNINQTGVDEFIKATAGTGMKGKDVKEFKTILNENEDCYEATTINKRTIRQCKKIV